MEGNLRVPRQEVVVYTWDAKDIVGVVLVVIFLLVAIAAINAALWEYCGDVQRRQQQQPAQEEYELQQSTGAPQNAPQSQYITSQPL